MSNEDGYKGASPDVRAAVLIGILLALCLPLGGCALLFLLAQG